MRIQAKYSVPSDAETEEYLPRVNIRSIWYLMLTSEKNSRREPDRAQTEMETQKARGHSNIFWTPIFVCGQSESQKSR